MKSTTSVLRIPRLLAAAILLASLVTATVRAANTPNFVFFLVDDMGWIDPACYGNRFHETPNIDRLATQGMRFTNAYAACPVCSPTRASILTGKYPATLNLTDFIPGHSRPWEKLVVPEMNMNLPLEEITFAELLHPAGYVSASYGKWHLGGPAFFPGQQGFDEFIVTSGRHFAPRFNTTPETPVEDGTYLGDFLTTQAEQFLERHKAEPFVLYLPHYAVHIPLEADEALVEKYREKASREEFRPKIHITIQATGESVFEDEETRVVLSFLASLGVGDPKLEIKEIKWAKSSKAWLESTLSFSTETSLSKLLEYAEQVKTDLNKKILPGTRLECRVSPVNNPTYAAMVEHIDRSLGRIVAKLDELKLADNTVLIFF
ncbi:MAG TPA: sulfatase-like hydrolase/transferase, partial [Planctomycetaceae bacterium]|nr:sulfatase-like hydrolase/transferase [Planctomycetaceae bacterium]